MSVVSVFDETVSFGPAVAPETNRRLQMAVQARTRDSKEAERLLLEAQAEDPTCLPVYFATYKFYANAKKFEDAQRAARLALAEAARQGGFSADWTALSDEPLYASEAGLFYLFSLKALSFITLRRGHQDEASALLSHLQRLDPEDRSGGSVIRALADSLGLEIDP
ncbi:hypothetical protein [Methylomagnum sp.]